MKVQTTKHLWCVSVEDPGFLGWRRQDVNITGSRDQNHLGDCVCCISVGCTKDPVATKVASMDVQGPNNPSQQERGRGRKEATRQLGRNDD